MADTVLAGRYRLDKALGGTMAEVFLATDLELERRVVVKVLGRDADQARFEQEARAVATLGHPNIVQVFDYGEVDGRPYMVLEHLAGGTLEERLASCLPLQDAETRRIAHDVATGLAHAHARGLVHRDLKPANILFDSEDRAKIADFGIARFENAGTLTEAGTVMGTAAYISPEQGAGDPATPASDVYSFGVILFRMLTGQLPFTANSVVELVRLHREAPPPSVMDLRPDAPALLESVTAAALSKDPADRPPNGAALVAELGGTSGDAATTVLPVTRARAAGTSSPQRPRLPFAVIGAALLVLVLAGVALALAVTHGSGSSPPTSPSFTALSGKSTTHATTQASTPPASATQPTTTAPTTQPATTRATSPVHTTAPVTTQPLTTAPATTTIATTTPATTAPTTTTTVTTTPAPSG